MSLLGERHKRLVAFTRDCRDDMHEPDEAGISATVVGTVLDNAFGDFVSGEMVKDGFQEIVVVLRNENTGESESFNLASLIALARLADPSQL